MTVIDEVPASIGQRLVWFLEHYRSRTSSVSCPALFRIRGDFDESRIPVAAEALMSRHESLRTTLERRGRGLVQHVHDRLPGPVRTVALAADAEDALTAQLTAELAAPIPIQESPVRFTVWRFGSTDRVLCMNMHHLISDAWSCGVLVGEMVALFTGPPGWAGPSPPAPAGRLAVPPVHPLAAGGGRRRRAAGPPGLLAGGAARDAAAGAAGAGGGGGRGAAAAGTGHRRAARSGRGRAARLRPGRADHPVPGVPGPDLAPA